jgi:phosphopantothenoylcysteine decarboxylase/phosphopantothenate--cysteine ligase
MAHYDGLYMAAAPADFRVKNIAAGKIKKSETAVLELETNPDILENMTKSHPGKLYVGFALETEDFEKHAVEKLRRKKLDFIALNPMTPDFQPMGGDMNRIILFSKDGARSEKSLATKKEVAAWLVETTAGSGDTK